MAAGIVFLAVAILTAYDQLLVDYGDDSAYLLGKATPLATWIVTLATPFALYDFFTWARRSKRWWAIGVVAATFTLGWLLARDWSLQWLVQQDIEVSFDRDEFLEIMVGLWCACATALVIWVALRSDTPEREPGRANELAS